MWKWHLLLKCVRFFFRADGAFIHELRKLEAISHEALDLHGNDWVSNLARPKQPGVYRPVLQSAASVAVVLQGPLKLEDEFTLATVRHYRRIMPEARLIVSTWKTESSMALRAIEQAGAEVLTLDPVSEPGARNVNRQIVTTVAGIRRAREAGYSYVLKTRTDARIYNCHVLDFLAGLLRCFPVSSAAPQRGRLAVLDSATRLLVPNHPSDMLMFGYTDDLENYWATPHSLHRENNTEQRQTLSGVWSDHTPEVFLCESYLRRIGWPCERTIARWWQTLAELFVVVDRASLNYFWPKYDYAQEHLLANDDQLRALSLCGFRQWMNLHAFAKSLGACDREVQSLRVNEPLRAA